MNSLTEQFVIIIISTLVLFTSYSWNNIFQRYIDLTYGDNLTARIIIAIIVTITTLLITHYLLQKFSVNKEKLDTAMKSRVEKYVSSHFSAF